MKFTAAVLPLVALASAAPLTITVVGKSLDGIRPYRIGLPGASSYKGYITPKDVHGSDARIEEGVVHAMPFPSNSEFTSPPFVPEGRIRHGATGGRKPCHGNRKAVELSNWLRKTFGMPTIHVEAVHGHGHSVHKVVHIQVIEPVGPMHVHGHEHQGHRQPHIMAAPVQTHAPMHGHKLMKDWHKRPFADRLTHALMSLGRWEGRFVAFVLGCGIGVLLRLVWVMTILTMRSFRNRHTDDEEDEHEVALTEEEQSLLPPPEYTDEKAALVVQEERRGN